jgi:hypothetical protein
MIWLHQRTPIAIFAVALSAFTVLVAESAGRLDTRAVSGAGRGRCPATCEVEPH